MWVHPSDEENGVLQTQTASKTLNPVYHEIFTIPMSDKDLNASTLIIQVRSIFQSHACWTKHFIYHICFYVVVLEQVVMGCLCVFLGVGQRRHRQG